MNQISLNEKLDLAYEDFKREFDLAHKAWENALKVTKEAIIENQASLELYQKGMQKILQSLESVEIPGGLRSRGFLERTSSGSKPTSDGLRTEGLDPCGHKPVDFNKIKGEDQNGQ